MSASNPNIRRQKRANNFTILNNETINDGQISAQSLGVLLYILSKPDNWQARQTEILKRFGSSKIGLTPNALTCIFKELRSVGYIKLVPISEIQNGKRVFKGSEYVFADTPIFEGIVEYSELPTSSELGESSDVETLQTVGNLGQSEILPPHLISNNLVNNTKLNKKKDSVSSETQDSPNIIETKKATPKKELAFYDVYVQALTYFNEVTGSRLQIKEVSKAATSDAYKKVLHLCKNEGATIEILKGIIDFKNKEWAGTDQARYIHPDTLFAKVHYEKYSAEALGLVKTQVQPTNAKIAQVGQSVEPQFENPELEAKYQKYIASIVERVPALPTSKIENLNRSEYIDFCERGTMPKTGQKTKCEIASHKFTEKWYFGTFFKNVLLALSGDTFALRSPNRIANILESALIAHYKKIEKENE